MKCSVIFYDLADRWTADITFEHGMTCRDAAAMTLKQNGRPDGRLEGLIYRIGNERVYPEDLLEDGAALNIHRLLGGG